MWEVKGVEVSPDWLDPEPVEVLYEFDGPRIFTCRNRVGKLFLAYQCSEDKDALRFLMVPFSEGQVWGLTKGYASLRDALAQSRTWVVDLGNDWRPLRCWEVDIGSIPPPVLPAPGVMLWAHLTPIVRNALPRAAAGETLLAPVKSFGPPSLYTQVA